MISTTRYQIRDAAGSVVAEGQFESMELADTWSIGQDLAPGWTLFEQSGSGWVGVRHDPDGS